MANQIGGVRKSIKKLLHWEIPVGLNLGPDPRVRTYQLAPLCLTRRVRLLIKKRKNRLVAISSIFYQEAGPSCQTLRAAQFLPLDSL